LSSSQGDAAPDAVLAVTPVLAWARASSSGRHSSSWRQVFASVVAAAEAPPSRNCPRETSAPSLRPQRPTITGSSSHRDSSRAQTLLQPLSGPSTAKAAHFLAASAAADERPQKRAGYGIPASVNDLTRIGDVLKVWHLGNVIEAEVVKTPFYDPSGDRVNGIA
jgi:hypothetical protein